MSGAYGWKLVENYGELIVKLVAIAPGPPGNIQAVSDIVSETADTVVVRSSVTLNVTMAVEEYVMRGDFPPENNGRYPWGEEMLAMPRARV
jgi:hypothetical protein